ncbi:NAD(P)-dependent oxidoreductase [Rhodovulum sp. 12E13]|uniref:NAD(P)-dependent oxidoreductase n=1 Tax=Rhodovulum sp. 12E13 TaxID=2203891 RepID=UPI000E196C48|nr:NAD(P)-binding oxidoreductase [Rhodovulum sp. 12E13]RDC72813.1 NAD(P)-dependent oxidoreductase [Rhodovulum sp. 12E13]
MDVAVFGANGRTGRLIVAELARRGHAPLAITRRPVEVAGAAAHRVLDLSDTAAVREAAGGAAISALASSRGNRACSALAEALGPCSGLRLVTVAGAAVDAPGDRKPWPERRFGPLLARLVGEMILDRQREFAILTLAEARWTMLRPPRLTNGAATGRAALSFDRPVSGRVARADLAVAAVDALFDEELVRRAPFVAEARRGGGRPAAATADKALAPRAGSR